MKVLLAPSLFATTQQAARFAAHCNTRHTDAQFCVVADNSPSYKQAMQLTSSKVVFVDTQVDPSALRKGETLVPFVETETETTIGKILVVGFRVGLPGAEKPVYEKSNGGQSKPALVFIKYLPFDMLEKTNFDDLIQKHAGNQKYLFILEAPPQCGVWSGVWNNIPYMKFSSKAKDNSSPSTSSPTSVPYQEIFMKKNNISLTNRALDDSTPIPSPPSSSSSSSSSSTISPSISPAPAQRPRNLIFEDNAWGIVWRTYILLLFFGLLYYLLI